MDLIALYKDYLMIEKNYSEHTAISYINDIKGFESFLINEGFAKDLLGANRPRLARNYISYLDNQDLKKKTISRKLSSLKSFYNYLVFKDYIDINIFSDIRHLKYLKIYHISSMMKLLNIYLIQLIHQHP